MKENSIEEDIKDIEKYISFTSKRENFSHDTDWNWNKDLANKIEHILSDYKRVLKENEELLQEKINNQKIIALAQNDMLNYQAGFEDGKNGRTSAVQSIIENQQYYIFQKQIEKYERHIEKLKKENETLKAFTKSIFDGDIEKEYISVQKVKDKIEEIKQEKKKYGNCLIEMYEDELVNRDIKILQKLLESEEK